MYFIIKCISNTDCKHNENMVRNPKTRIQENSKNVFRELQMANFNKINFIYFISTEKKTPMYICL